jgi:hypothetical protein
MVGENTNHGAKPKNFVLQKKFDLEGQWPAFVCCHGYME